MVYHTRMIDSFIMAAYTIFILATMAGMVALGWFARGIIDNYYRRSPGPSERAPILQPTYAQHVAPPPTIQPLPQAVPLRTTISKFPSPREVRKRKEGEAVSSYLDSFMNAERKSGSFSLEKEMIDS